MRYSNGRFRKGFIPPTAFKKGHTSYRKGKHGFKCPGVSKANSLRIGPLHPRWKGRKFDIDGYVLIYQPHHPSVGKHGYVKEHRLVMEKFLGRFLEPKEIVHHINKIKNDNRIENLKLFKSDSDHLRMEHGFDNKYKFKKGFHCSPKTEFKKGQIPWNKGKSKYS